VCPLQVKVEVVVLTVEALEVVVVVVAVVVVVDVDALVEVLVVAVLVVAVLVVDVDAVVLEVAVLVELLDAGSGVCGAGQPDADELVLDDDVAVLRKGMLLKPSRVIGPTMGTAIGCDL